MAMCNKDMTNLVETILKIKYDERREKKIITQLIQRIADGDEWQERKKNRYINKMST